MKENNKFLIYSCEHDVIKGSNHQLFNLFALLAEASILSRTAVAPDLLLDGIHNANNPLSVTYSKYVDLSPCKDLVSVISFEEFIQLNIDDRIGPEKIVSEDFSTEDLKLDPFESSPVVVRNFNNVVFKSPMRSNELISDRFYHLRSLSKPSKEILKIVEEITAQLSIFNIVHVRRNDFLQEAWWTYPGLDKGTRPKAIRRRISQWMDDGCNLYIMSDETKINFFSPLETWYEVFTYRSFPALERIKQDDNFLLYEVEKALAERAHIRVEMFNSYPQYGKFNYSLFDYPRTGTTSPFYYAIARGMDFLNRIRARDR